MANEPRGLTVMNIVKSAIKIFALSLAFIAFSVVYFFYSFRLNVAVANCTLIYVCLNLALILFICFYHLQSKKRRIRENLQRQVECAIFSNSVFQSKNAKDIATYLQARLAMLYSLPAESIDPRIDLWSALELKESILKPDIQHHFIFGKYSQYVDPSIWIRHVKLIDIANEIGSYPLLPSATQTSEF